MSTTLSSTVVSIFRDSSMAEQAMEALCNAGFDREHIRYSVPGSSGGFLSDIKSFFTGSPPSGTNLTDEMASMGLSDEEAQYYAKEYSSGSTILVVDAHDREEETLSILHRYGAYHVTAGKPDTSEEAASDALQSSEHNRIEPQAAQPVASESAEEPHSSQTPQTSAETHDPQAVQASAETPTQGDELQQLQEMLRATQQQLQEAKAQLQATKEREAQFKEARAREQQLQTTRKQLQDMHAELQATLVELRETQARLAQHQTSSNA